jgi:hypothetical protein
MKFGTNVSHLKLCTSKIKTLNVMYTDFGLALFYVVSFII